MDTAKYNAGKTRREHLCLLPVRAMSNVRDVERESTELVRRLLPAVTAHNSDRRTTAVYTHRMLAQSDVVV